MIRHAKFFTNSEYAVVVSDYQLQQLLSQLTNLLVEKRVEYKDDWNAFQKVVNNLVLKILDQSEHTAVICALLRILYDCVALPKPNADQHHQELIMKCIWKIVKYIPKWDADLNYSKVLCEVNRFLNDFPSNWWKKQSIDTPLRTYKTIVHTMVSLRGVEIMTIAHCIPGFTQQSELFHYIDKLLRHMKLGEKMDSALDNAAPDTQKENVVPILELPKILKKISNQEETQQGLKMLYDFQKCHPEVDIKRFLSRSTKHFQQYVFEGLEALKNEKEGKDAFHSLNIPGNKYIDGLGTESDCNDKESANEKNGSEESPKSDTQCYKRILKMLNDGNERVVAVSSVNLVSSLISTTHQEPYKDSENAGTTLEQLRQKLSLLKGGN